MKLSDITPFYPISGSQYEIEKPLDGEEVFSTGIARKLLKSGEPHTCVLLLNKNATRGVWAWEPEVEKLPGICPEINEMNSESNSWGPWPNDDHPNGEVRNWWIKACEALI